VAPAKLATWMQPFSESFTAPSWQHVLVLVVGAILTPGRRTVAAALRVTGLDQDAHFTNYHRVLNRNRWSSRAIARQLFRLLVSAFVPQGPVIIGLDDTLERRWGAKIKARGIYRDPVRSSHGHFVKASGLRWLSVMLLPDIPWARRVWGLPFLTALAPSQRYASERQRRHKKLTDWGRQVLLQAARWLPERDIIAVADSSYAAIDLLNAVRRRICMITRLRLDARLFDPPARRRPGTVGRPSVIGRRQPALAERLTNPGTRWRRLQVTGWYGRGERRVEIVSRHRPLASSRSPRANPLRAGPRCRRPTQAAGVLVYRSRCRPDRHSPLVRPPLVDRGHLRRGPTPSRRRNPTPMV
jgi:hypothetical protein